MEICCNFDGVHVKGLSVSCWMCLNNCNIYQEFLDKS